MHAWLVNSGLVDSPVCLIWRSTSVLISSHTSMAQGFMIYSWKIEREKKIYRKRGRERVKNTYWENQWLSERERESERRAGASMWAWHWGYQVGLQIPSYHASTHDTACDHNNIENGLFVSAYLSLCDCCLTISPCNLALGFDRSYLLHWWHPCTCKAGESEHNIKHWRSL